MEKHGHSRNHSKAVVRDIGNSYRQAIGEVVEEVTE